MIKDSTKQIIKRTLQSSFDKEQFLNFAKNLLNHINEDKAFHAHGYVKEQFKKTANIIKTYERLGTYTDPNEKKIDILVVYLEKENSIDRARTSLRNFVADYLKGRDQKDAALVAFVSPKFDDWRFSLVKMDYKFEEGKNGKIKVKEEFTPARRWSFLVGAKESSHTAQSRLAPILEDDENSPTLEQLEDAFNIEKVTKEFFEKYRELFLLLKDNLDKMVENDSKIKADFVEKDVDTVDFAKKLLGQIVFLYFLQKKGWFGVERDADWGTGPKDFLRQLFQEKHSGYKNFFNEILEPMFYEALARERDDDYYGRFNCKIPFLNGGLFDPIGNYDWVHTDINLDNELFSNSRPTKQGDIGDGILDIFDRYNFTVREDEPLEKEVAVDPEMLGKVFENLLEVKDRKSKGTYYTPREIVHYMCEQSLVNYLNAELESKVKKEDIEEFIKIGEQVLENEYWAAQKEDSSSSKIPDSIKNNAEAIDGKLAEIKVCDPAIGSGAFPVGMMNEIVSARLSLNPFLCESSQGTECAGRTAYDFKMQAITNSIYGVDIDPGAVEIAKLRLWLSLVVDENNIKQIKPLPNLDYKIMQGNSLLEEFEGIKLFDESIIPQDSSYKDEQIKIAQNKISELHHKLKDLQAAGKLSKAEIEDLNKQAKTQKKIIASFAVRQNDQSSQLDFDGQRNEIMAKWDELSGLHKKIVSETNRQDKKKMLYRASELEWQFIEASLRKEGKIASLNKIAKYKKLNTKPFFLWHLHFADVFQKKDGFDIVIANPPYIRIHKQEQNDNIKASIKRIYVSAYKDFDYYVLFIEKGLTILRKEGVLAYITPDKYLVREYGLKIRNLILQNSIVELFDLSRATDIFDAATYPLISILQKTDRIDKVSIKIARTIQNLAEQYKKIILSKQKCIDDGRIEIIDPELNDLISKIFSLGSKLSDILEPDQIFCGTPRAIDYHSWSKYITNQKTTKDSLRVLVCSNIQPYVIDTKKKVRTIGLSISTPYFCNDEGAISEKRWRDFAFIPKILIRGNDTRITAVLDEEGSVFIGVYGIKVHAKIARDYKYLLSLLNSKLYQWIFSIQNPSIKIGGEFFSINAPHILRLPFRPISNIERDNFNGTVDKILALTRSDDYLTNLAKQAKVHEFERQIDQMVYKLYDLTPDEIKIVENSK